MIPSERSHLHVAANSHPGMSGKNNEDRYAISAYRLETASSSPVLLGIVSDGIGGHQAGEVAAENVVKSIIQIVSDSEGDKPLSILHDAITQASQEVLELSESQPEKRGMGATCACVLVIDYRLFIAYVGDSRIYLLRGKVIQQLSTDHTWIQEAISAGVLNPAQAREHPNAHVIHRYLGSQQSVKPDFRLRLNKNESNSQAEKNQGMQLHPGDFLVLCSDGLTDLVNAEEILNGFQNSNLEKSVDDLINLANQRGGHDNITIVAIHVPLAVSPSNGNIQGKSHKSPLRQLTCLILAFLILVSLLIIILAAYFFVSRFP